MPTNRRRSMRTQKVRMTSDKMWYLKTGFYLDGARADEKFAGEAEARAAWEDHGEEILEGERNRGAAGMRPWGWYKFGQGIDGPRMSGEFHASVVEQEAWLLENGHLEQWEVPTVEKRIELFREARRRENDRRDRV